MHAYKVTLVSTSGQIMQPIVLVATSARAMAWAQTFNAGFIAKFSTIIFNGSLDN